MTPVDPTQLIRLTGSRRRALEFFAGRVDVRIPPQRGLAVAVAKLVQLGLMEWQPVGDGNRGARITEAGLAALQVRRRPTANQLDALRRLRDQRIRTISTKVADSLQRNGWATFYLVNSQTGLDRKHVVAGQLTEIGRQLLNAETHELVR